MTSLLRMERYVDNCSVVFTRKLREFGKTGQALDMARWLQFYAFDVIGELTVGKRFGFLDEGKDVGGIISAIDAYLAYTANVGVYSEWHPFITSMMQKLAPGKGRGSMVEFAQEQIDRRKQDGSSPHELDGTGDFLSIYLALNKKDPDYFTEQDLFAGCITNIGAGSDTTSISLSSVLYNLCRHPEVLQKLREELEEKKAKGELSNPVTFKESQACPYLQAVIKEALRVHPATGLPLGRVVPEGGATIAGTFFPEGAIVGINSWVAHKNVSVFGPDAEIFRPDRWLTDKENYNRMDRYFFTFGMGSRTCIGKNISLMELGKVIPMLIQEFDFELVNPDADCKTRNIWFVKQQNFLCRVFQRHN